MKAVILLACLSLAFGSGFYGGGGGLIGGGGSVIRTPFGGKVKKIAVNRLFFFKEITSVSKRQNLE